jgi:cell division septation protein DedD
LAKAADQFRQSDVTLWGVIALSAWVVAILGANLSGLVPPSVYGALHASRLEGSTLNQLRSEVAALEEETTRIRRETTEMTQRLALSEDTSGLVAKRVGALEISVPKLIEESRAQTVARIDSMSTGSIGAGKTVTFETDGGTVEVQQRPLAPGSDEIRLTPVPVASASPAPLASTMPAPLEGKAALGVALGFPLAPPEAEAEWQEMLGDVGTLLVGLSPVLVEGENGLKQLVAGPIIDRASALELCGQLDARGVPCEPASYSGEPLPLLN